MHSKVTLFKNYINLNFYFKNNDDVALCQVNSDGRVSLYHNYNLHGNSLLLLSTNPTVGFSDIVTTYTNGVASCSFTRINYMSNVPNYFDINNQYYILTASGPVISGI